MANAINRFVRNVPLPVSATILVRGVKSGQTIVGDDAISGIGGDTLIGGTGDDTFYVAATDQVAVAPSVVVDTIVALSKFSA